MTYPNLSPAPSLLPSNGSTTKFKDLIDTSHRILDSLLNNEERPDPEDMKVLLGRLKARGLWGPYSSLGYVLNIKASTLSHKPPPFDFMEGDNLMNPENLVFIEKCISAGYTSILLWGYNFLHHKFFEEQCAEMERVSGANIKFIYKSTLILKLDIYGKCHQHTKGLCNIIGNFFAPLSEKEKNTTNGWLQTIQPDHCNFMREALGERNTLNTEGLLHPININEVGATVNEIKPNNDPTAPRTTNRPATLGDNAWNGIPTGLKNVSASSLRQGG